MPFLVLTVIFLFITAGIGILFAMKSKEYAIEKSIFSFFIFRKYLLKLFRSQLISTLNFLVINLYSYLIVNALFKEISLRERNYPAFLAPRSSPQQVFETTYVKIP